MDVRWIALIVVSLMYMLKKEESLKFKEIRNTLILRVLSVKKA